MPPETPTRTKTLAGTSELTVGLGRGLEAAQKGFVVGMRTDPKPNKRVPISDTEGAPRAVNAHRVYGLGSVDLLEPKRGMLGIRRPQDISRSSLVLNGLRQGGELSPKAFCSARLHGSYNGTDFPARCSTKASSAKRASGS